MIVKFMGGELDMFAEKASLIAGIKMGLAKKMKVKDLEKPVHFLGIEWDWSPYRARGLRQPAFINKLQLNTRMMNPKPVGSPFNPSRSYGDYEKSAQSCSAKHEHCRSIVGSLLYRDIKLRHSSSVARSMQAYDAEISHNYRCLLPDSFFNT